MKRIFVTFVVFLTMIANAQNRKEIKNQNTMENRILEIENKLALKALVDTFSNLSDIKNVDNQVLLFTEEAQVQSYMGGNLVSDLKGRKQIGEAFSAYLALFDTVYHQNGQQTVEINGDQATGISYCQVVLIGDQNGKRIANTSYVIYNDIYQKIGGKWYIKHRKSNFVWSKQEEAGR